MSKMGLARLQPQLNFIRRSPTHRLLVRRGLKAWTGTLDSMAYVGMLRRAAA